MSLPTLRTAKIKGRTLAWREQGDGAALVLIHGIGGSSESWAPLFDRFARTYRVIAWDAPGYGGSDLPADRSATAEDYAALLAALLDIRGAMAAHVVGHSIGAPVAAALWHARPSVVASLVLVHPVSGFGGLPADEREKLRTARLSDIEGLSMEAFGKARAPMIVGDRAGEGVAAEVARIIATIPETGYRAMVEVMASADLSAALPAIRVPALAIAGEDDRIAPPASVRAIADALAGAEYEAFPGIGHYLPLEDAPAFMARLEEFLARHDGAARAATYS